MLPCKPNVSDPRDQINGFLHPNGQKTVSEQEQYLENLAKELSDAKLIFADYKRYILELENAILALHPAKTEGITRVSTPSFKISTTGKMTRRITDIDALIELAPQLVTNKPQLNMKEFNALSRSNPVLMQKVLSCIESKPAKTSVSIDTNGE